MKKYIKPTLEVKEFKATEKIADLNDWLTQGDGSGMGINVAEANVTSYYAAS